MHQARAEEITLKEDFISVPLPLDDDFGKSKKEFVMVFLFLSFLGDANGLDEPEFFRKLQPSLHFNAHHSNLDIDSTNLKKSFFSQFNSFI
jgi:hypothetical protein